MNDIRQLVDAWRDDGYQGTSAVSRRLLHHWRSEDNVPRLFFAQVEALETLIWITEVARSDHPARQAIEDAAKEHNDGIVRYCTKMATGTGKTAVMGMVIAWNAANVAAGGNRRHPGRYFTSFVAITPGHTVRERLAVLDPSSPDNVYDELSLVPAGLRGDLGRVRLRVVNFQAFQCRDRLGEATGDARRLLRRGDAGRDPETPAATTGTWRGATSTATRTRRRSAATLWPSSPTSTSDAVSGAGAAVPAAPTAGQVEGSHP